MDVFVVREPFYDVCESWAEEPSAAAWDADFADLCAALVRLN